MNAVRIALLLASVVSLGCVTRIADLTLVANRNVGNIPEPIAKDVVGRHCQVIWAAGQQPNLEEAIDLAQKTTPGANALANVAIYYEYHWYFLFTQLCFRVEGDAVQIEAHAAQ